MRSKTPNYNVKCSFQMKCSKTSCKLVFTLHFRWTRHDQLSSKCSFQLSWNKNLYHFLYCTLILIVRGQCLLQYFRVSLIRSYSQMMRSTRYQTHLFREWKPKPAWGGVLFVLGSIFLFAPVHNLDAIY